MGALAAGASGQDLLQRREEVRQAKFLELFVDLVLVFALAGVVSRVTRDIVSEDIVTRWRALAFRLGPGIGSPPVSALA